MKALSATKVQRGNNTEPAKTLSEWINSGDQATVAGCADFLARQRARIKAAQAKPQKFIVVDIRKRP